MPSGTPSASVYVKNINTKVKKEGMRGQAFVVFRDMQSATSALRGLDGFEFYDKPLVIEYARKKSYASLVQEHGEEALLNPGWLSRISEGTLQPTTKVTYSHAQADAEGQDKKRAREDAPTGAAPVAEEARPAKTQRTESDAKQTNNNEEEDDDDGRLCD
ncbi:hypothetical protein CBS14141_000197 [Malassezia furfur]|nr:hypothetical protein CBS14141_000197 [Malassezia furfur]